MKVFISVDMEGVTGVTDPEDVLPEGADYARGRVFMTGDANAAILGAYDAGADEVLVNDSHWTMRNLLLEDLDPRARMIKGFQKPMCMVQGLDPSYDAAVFIGYHASTSNPKGVRAHTISSAHFTRLALNGTAVTEAELNAAYAGDFGVPVVFASGDDAAVAEIKSRLGDIDTVTTKATLGFHSAETLTPAASCERIYEGVLAALNRKDRRHPYVLAHPVTLDLSFKSYMPAEILSYLRSVQRVDAHTIRFVGHDMQEVTDFIDVLDWYNPDMTP